MTVAQHHLFFVISAYFVSQLLFKALLSLLAISEDPHTHRSIKVICKHRWKNCYSEEKQGFMLGIPTSYPTRTKRCPWSSLIWSSVLRPANGRVSYGRVCSGPPTAATRFSHWVRNVPCQSGNCQRLMVIFVVAGKVWWKMLGRVTRSSSVNISNWAISELNKQSKRINFAESVLFKDFVRKVLGFHDWLWGEADAKELMRGCPNKSEESSKSDFRTPPTKIHYKIKKPIQRG